jgi:DNA-binding PadR family transcriptional regulator
MPKPEDLLPLTPAVLHILLALADGEKHGYAIMQEAEKISHGQVTMGPGTLYGSIKRMLQMGLIVEAEQRAEPGQDDERRRYYRLSDFGSRVLEAETRRLELLLAALHRKPILRGQEQ